MEENEFISSANIDLKTLWNDILEEIAKEVSTVIYDVWIKNLVVVDLKENTIVLSTQTEVSKDAILKDYKKIIIACCNKVYKAITNIEIEVDSPSSTEEETPTVTEPKSRVYVSENTKTTLEPVTAFKFNPKYTFDNFIVGGSNQFACAVAKAVAESPSTKINPLFIYGGAGLGKTHLLHAIGNHIQENHPKLNVVYVTANKFTDDFVTSLQNNSVAKFKEIYSKADVLIIDDIQQLIKKVQTQEQFFNIFNELHQNGKQIVITSDKQPKELNPLEDRLRSRFEWGMLADIGVPDIETRIAILNKKAQIERYNVSREVIEYIAEVATSNVRVMEGFLMKTVFYSGLLGESMVTIETAREALKDIVDESQDAIDGTKVIETVCKFYKIKKEELLGKKRTKTIAEARQIAMYLCTEYLSIPLQSIGAMFGKNHGTVIYAKNKVVDDMKKSKKMEIEVNDLKQMIEGK